jgi:ligand-binding sensor domain-containing protein
MELPAGANRFVDRTPPGGDPDSVSRRAPAALDSQGRIIVSTAQGVARWENGVWRRFGSANGLKSGLLSALVFDTNGDAWLGSSRRGLFQ